MERRNSLSTMDGVGELWLWRAAFHFLPAAFLDAGSRTGICGAVERGAGRVYRFGADARRSFHVCVGAAVSFDWNRRLWSGLLCRKPVCAARRVYAQRFCRRTGLRFSADVAAGDTAIMRVGGKPLAFTSSRDLGLCVAFYPDVAFECTGGRDGQLQRCTPFCLGIVSPEIARPFVARRRRVGARIRPSLLLSCPGRLRAALGEYRAGAFVWIAAGAKLFVHTDQRSGTQPVQLGCFDRGGVVDRDDRSGRARGVPKPE